MVCASSYAKTIPLKPPGFRHVHTNSKIDFSLSAGSQTDPLPNSVSSSLIRLRVEGHIDPSRISPRKLPAHIRARSFHQFRQDQRKGRPGRRDSDTTESRARPAPENLCFLSEPVLLAIEAARREVRGFF